MCPQNILARKVLHYWREAQLSCTAIGVQYRHIALWLAGLDVIGLLRITLNTTTSALVEHPRYVYVDSRMVLGVLYRKQVSRQKQAITFHI